MYLTIFFIDVLTYLVFFSFFYFSGRSFLILLTRFTNNGEIPEYTLFQKTKILYPADKRRELVHKRPFMG